MDDKEERETRRNEKIKKLRRTSGKTERKDNERST